MHEAADTCVERGLSRVPDSVDVRRADVPVGIAGHGDVRREVIHDVDIFERAPQRGTVDDVGDDELDVESGERDSRLPVDRADDPSLVEERAHEVGADVTRRAGDGCDHARAIDSYSCSYAVIIVSALKRSLTRARHCAGEHRSILPTAATRPSIDSLR